MRASTQLGRLPIVCVAVLADDPLDGCNVCAVCAVVQRHLNARAPSHIQQKTTKQLESQSRRRTRSIWMAFIKCVGPANYWLRASRESFATQRAPLPRACANSYVIAALTVIWVRKSNQRSWNQHLGAARICKIKQLCGEPNNIRCAVISWQYRIQIKTIINAYFFTNIWNIFICCALNIVTDQTKHIQLHNNNHSPSKKLTTHLRCRQLNTHTHTQLNNDDDDDAMCFRRRPSLLATTKEYLITAAWRSRLRHKLHRGWHL